MVYELQPACRGHHTDKKATLSAHINTVVVKTYNWQCYIRQVLSRLIAYSNRYFNYFKQLYMHVFSCKPDIVRRKEVICTVAPESKCF